MYFNSFLLIYYLYAYTNILDDISVYKEYVMIKDIIIDGKVIGKKYGEVLPSDTAGEHDDDIHAPSVIYDGSIYHMWYGGRWRIFYATSTDGIVWTKHGAIKLLGTNGEIDDNHIYRPSVIKDGATYKMWYSSYDGNNYRIYYTTSTDGISWIKHGLVVSLGTISDSDDYVDIYTSSVLLYNDTYHIWYGGHDGSDYIIHYATSTDGITWVKHGTVVLSGTTGGSDDYGIKSPSVIYDGTTYIMWYTGYDGSKERIHYATSTDGIIFDKHGVVVPLEINDEDIDEYNPYVIYDGSIYKMWYGGYDGINIKIKYAELLDLSLR